MTVAEAVHAAGRLTELHALQQTRPPRTLQSLQSWVSDTCSQSSNKTSQAGSLRRGTCMRTKAQQAGMHAKGSACLPLCLKLDQAVAQQAA